MPVIDASASAKTVARPHLVVYQQHRREYIARL